MGRMLQFFLEAGQLHVEQAFQLMGRHVAGGHDAQVIADERRHPLILEDGGILAEDGAGSGLLDVRLDGHHAFAAALVEYFVMQPQHFQIEGLGETGAEHLQRFAEHHLGGAPRVGLQESTQRGTADDHEFEWMEQRSDLAAGKCESAQHTGEHNDDAEDLYHMGLRLKPVCGPLAADATGHPGTTGNPVKGVGERIVLVIGTFAPD